MKTGRASRVFARILLAVCLTLAPSGCKDADTVTGVQPLPTPVPTPIPTPAPLDLNGEWTGALTYGSYFRTYASCSTESIRMQVDHRVDGRIFGTADPSCAPTIHIDGTVGAQLGASAPVTVRLWLGLDLLGELSGTVTSREIRLASAPTTETTSISLSR